MRWEYMLVEVQNDKGWKARYVNGSEIPNWKKGLHISSWLCQRGDEGWELISWTVTGTGGNSFGQGADVIHAVLKRQKP